ncbi:MAG: hypothetical protein JW990_06990 [Thermoleophilia bacterium]|nr:hypothetical protein [Thermoleophilia bacterium]
MNTPRRSCRSWWAAVLGAAIAGVAIAACVLPRAGAAVAEVPEATISTVATITAAATVIAVAITPTEVGVARDEGHEAEDLWDATLRSSVEQAASELDFEVFSLGDSFGGYPLTEIRVRNNSLYLYYRFDPSSAEAEAANWEGFLIREFSTAANATHIGELRAAYPVVGHDARRASRYEVRRGAGRNRSLIMTQRKGTTLMVTMFVNPDPAALADAADALKEAVR